MLDVLITGGIIMDGTGSAGYYGSIGVEGEKVRIFRGDVSAMQAHKLIDAAGCIVCPGFIDLHSHAGLVMLAEPRHEPKVRQGVTTELIGIDGLSYAPVEDQKDFDDLVEMNSGLDGAPQLPGRWGSVAEYLSMFDGKVAINVAYIIGNSPLRVIGVGWDDREATGAELEKMKSLLREGMEEGAFGLSTGLDYPPGSYASTEELIELSKEAARWGGIYHTHVRYGLGDQFLDPFREALEIGRKAELPCHLTHFYQGIAKQGPASDLIGLVESSRNEGLDVTFDCYPYVYSSTRLLIFIPQWAHDGGIDKMKQVLASAEGRARIREESSRSDSYDDIYLTYFKKPHNRQYEGRTLAQVAESMGKDPIDAMCDLLLDEDLQTSFVSPGVNANTLAKFVAHPMSMVGTDALLLGDYPSPRSYGAFPKILSDFVRDEEFLPLPQAIRKMTSFPAQRLGLKDRGILRDGMHADIVVFNNETIDAPGTRDNPKQYPKGIEYVIVNGKIVVEKGQHTGTLPGRGLRRGRD